ncbi:MAG TPA: serine/threonine-protein kinase [Verrucomicrobiota bacterium]|nr:serine/threonine-protein kinase [Verrucomicrobiota bacterium]
MEFKPGIKIENRFEIRQHIEAGGYGQVWEGFDLELKRPIAIKRLLRTHLGKVDKSDIVQEAQRIAAVNHPNIVAVYDVLESADEVLIVMEYLPGGSLHSRLRALSRKSAWISAPDALRLIRDVLCGLEAAHTCEGGPVIHRDLKPQNILFDRNETAKIVDFGQAVVGEVNPLPTWERKAFGEHEGTLGYKSPEQLQGQKLDPRTDLFNVGMVGYLMFAAIHPFTDERFLFTQREMVLEPYRRLPVINRQPLPKELELFVIRLLETEPPKRFDSATQALSEFEHVEKAFKDLLQDRCLHHYDALVAGQPSPEVLNSLELAAGLAILKQNRFFVQAKLLYEKGGLELSHISEATKKRVNEDYALCCRRLEEVHPTEDAPQS